MNTTTDINTVIITITLDKWSEDYVLLINEGRVI